MPTEPSLAILPVRECVLGCTESLDSSILTINGRNNTPSNQNACIGLRNFGNVVVTDCWPILDVATKAA